MFLSFCLLQNRQDQSADLKEKHLKESTFQICPKWLGILDRKLKKIYLFVWDLHDLTMFGIIGFTF